MSETPETDANSTVSTSQEKDGFRGYITAVFARRLERERDLARKHAADAIREKGARIEELKRDLQALKDDMSLRLAELEEVEKQRDAAREDAERLANAMRLIVKPLGNETETSGNPCVSPNPEQGRAIAKALAAHEALIAKK